MPKRRVVRGDGPPRRAVRSEVEEVVWEWEWGERLVVEEEGVVEAEEEKMWWRAFMFSWRFVTRSWRRRISPVERVGSVVVEEGESEER